MPRRRKEGNSTASRGLQHLQHRQIITKEKPQQRNAANARERARMRVLSRAFCRLKTTLPWVPADTKLSKLDTLRLATTYIGHLRTVLIEGNSSTERTSSPLPSRPVMSWPFMFNKCGSGPSDPSTSDGLDSPTSTMDHFNIHDCLPEDETSQRPDDKTPTDSSSGYLPSRYQSNGIDYCNMGINYCNDPMELA